ncbi:hypothetical protein ASPWEDRAFT_176037 [Aspergillus wentii DTO 134E9]|uniref:Uncharacterized protein n=1 Tax=Aspergillus wentii DTO 134E9 TaxID=1073089 RepID=A0A1L9R7N3_ASPWE|nr:uncharacterized protein ASPWEDRAFT_176037 [Aspergillus wentii DTO 134E9]KAI9927555.1 hypothetical protein MW887_003173 [Aspergillus wentii]OJJ30932.1 hypothetical protein ASPWEDRAFT_176037 [Aspergillus wentii DTO 134E9]
MAQPKALKGLLSLLLLLFTFCILPATSYPTSLSHDKRTLNPAMPTVAEAQKHLKHVGKDKSIFYLSEVGDAVHKYAKAHGLKIISDADDGSHWATMEGGPFLERSMREIDDQPTWTDNELSEAMQVVSNAFAANAEGEVHVILPYHMPSRKNHWTGEFEELKKNKKVTKVWAFDMKNAHSMPKGKPRELWPHAQPKTEHAG